MLRLILGDQLSNTISSLVDVDKAKDLVFMCEVMQEAKYVKHHKKKIVFLFSAMRHFALSLKKLGLRVCYIKIDDPANTGSFDTELKRIIAQYEISKITRFIVNKIMS